MQVENDTDRFLASWRRTTEPVRPSLSELEYMRRKLTQRKAAPHVLLLGLTPELVDLALEAGAARVAVIDIRPQALEVLPRLASRDWRDVDMRLGDWSEYRVEFEGAFDVLLGHGSLVHAAFPNEWATTLRTWRRYLVPGGSAVLRTFVTPSGVWSFANCYEARLQTFDASSGDQTARFNAFMRLSSDVRCAAILEAAQPDGSVDHRKLATTIEFIDKDLRRRYEADEIWPVVDSEFNAPTAPGFETLWPMAAPRFIDAKAVIEAAGFIVDAKFIGERPVPDCFCVITATRPS